MYKPAIKEEIGYFTKLQNNLEHHLLETTPSLTNRVNERMCNKTLKHTRKETIKFDKMDTNKGKGKDPFANKSCLAGLSTQKPT